MRMSDKPSGDWQMWWDARVSAIESVLGKCEDLVGHAPIPFDFGANLGGTADVVYFRKHLSGVIAVTSELIGRDDQVRTGLGNYELMVCARDDVTWGANIISRLTPYTLEAALNPGETMEIGPVVPDRSTIAAFLFYEYARFDIRGRRCGLLLCVGITADELEACHDGQRARVDVSLKRSGVYPYTDFFRLSALRTK
jgi:hypothetical protein